MPSGKLQLVLLCLLAFLSLGIYGCVGTTETDQPYKPAMIVVLRHGEKPPEGNNLDAQGQERARALVNVFSTRPDLNAYGKPVVIYAMGPSPEDPSNRPVQTVLPTSQALGIPMVTHYTHLQYADVAREIYNTPSYQGRTVIICWEHHVIPDLIKSLGVHHGPKKWDGRVFDQFWIVRFPGGVPTLSIEPQNALPSDSR